MLDKALKLIGLGGSIGISESIHLSGSLGQAYLYSEHYIPRNKQPSFMERRIYLEFKGLDY